MIALYMFVPTYKKIKTLQHQRVHMASRRVSPFHPKDPDRVTHHGVWHQSISTPKANVNGGSIVLQIETSSISYFTWLQRISTNPEKNPRVDSVQCYIMLQSTSSYSNHENRKRSASQSRTARPTLGNMFREQCIHCGVQASNSDPKQNHQDSWIRLAEHLDIAGSNPSATSKNPTPGICFPSWPSDEHLSRLVMFQ